MITNWTNTGGLIQGDVAITLERSKVYSDYVEFNITGYSEKWSKYDISFEYRKDPRDEWKIDSSIIFAQSDYIIPPAALKLAGIIFDQDEVFFFEPKSESLETSKQEVA